MSRLSRKNRNDIAFKNHGGLFDLFDNQVKAVFRIDDDEYDYLAENMSEVELALFVEETLSFGEKRRLLTAIEAHLERFHHQSPHPYKPPL